MAQYSFGHCGVSSGTGAYVTAIVQMPLRRQRLVGFLHRDPAGRAGRAVNRALELSSDSRLLLRARDAGLCRGAANRRQRAPITGAGVGTLIKLDCVRRRSSSKPGTVLLDHPGTPLGFR